MGTLLPIIILHGWGACASRWQKVKSLLEGKGFNVFVPDLPGFGEEPPPTLIWGLYDYAEWVVREFKKRNWSKFILIGHSFGGSVAVKVAVNYPDQVARLILVNSAGIRISHSSLKLRVWLPIVHFGHFLFNLPLLKNRQEFIRRILYKILGSVDYFKAAGVKKEILKKILREDIRQDLPKIQAPTLIVWAEKDRQTPLAWAKIFAGNIPKAKLRIVSSANHTFPYFEPEKFVELITGEV